MENVKHLITKEHMPGFIEWIGRLKELGYHSEWKVLNAKDHGLPQSRERVIMVSALKGEYVNLKTFFPKKKPLLVSLGDLMEKDSEVDPKLFFPSHRPVMEMNRLPSLERTDRIQRIGLMDGATFSRNRIYSYTGIAPTLTLSSKNHAPRIWTGRRVRLISALEAWRLMGIPDRTQDSVKQRFMKKQGAVLLSRY